MLMQHIVTWWVIHFVAQRYNCIHPEPQTMTQGEMGNIVITKRCEGLNMTL